MKTIDSSIFSGHPRGDPRRDPWKIIFRMKPRLRVYLCVKNQASRPGKRHFRIKSRLRVSGWSPTQRYFRIKSELRVYLCVKNHGSEELRVSCA